MVRPYTQKAKATFPVAVDTSDLFGAAFGLKAIPVTYLIDEVGIIRLQGAGPTAALRQQIEEILKEPMVRVSSRPPALLTSKTLQELETAVQDKPNNAALALALAQNYTSAGRPNEALTQLSRADQLSPNNSAILFAWGMALFQNGERDAALVKLKQARDLDPNNWRIRKQVWAIENPDKFYKEESPDYEWQREQIKKENDNHP